MNQKHLNALFETAGNRKAVTNLFKSAGATLHDSDKVTGWYVFPNEDKAQELRGKIPFLSLFQGPWEPHEGKKGFMLIVYFDKVLEPYEDPKGKMIAHLEDRSADLTAKHISATRGSLEEARLAARLDEVNTLLNFAHEET